jgi:peptidoglycan/LPS O-acetylase OafA/YrhL
MKALAIRTVVGFGVSVYAAAAIPLSGWYQWRWFSQHELACVFTAGVIVVVLAFVLKGFQKRLGVALGNAS